MRFLPVARAMRSRFRIASIILGGVTAMALHIVSGMALAQNRRDPEPMIARQGADHFSFRVGGIEITALSDGSNTENLDTALMGIDPAEIRSLLDRNFMTNPVESSVNDFLFKFGGRTVLVDTGVGSFRGPDVDGMLMQSLASINVDPSEITDVLITHAHFDHVGGLVCDKKLMFPNATVHVSRTDYEFFNDPANKSKNDYPGSIFGAAKGIFAREKAAGRLQTFESGEEVVPGVVATVHSGHTPGSAFFRLSINGDSIVFTGDIVHVVAVQMPMPHVTVQFDVDQSKAAGVREHAFADFADNRTLLAIPHAYFPGVGHVRQTSSGYEWVPVAYANRTPDVGSSSTSGDK